MNQYILLMHRDSRQTAPPPQEWDAYLARLQQSGAFQGGSAIGDGECVSKDGIDVIPTSSLAGYIVIQAEDLEHARDLVRGNPLYEAGGTVEIRALPKT